MSLNFKRYKKFSKKLFFNKILVTLTTSGRTCLRIFFTVSTFLKQSLLLFTYRQALQINMVHLSPY